MLRVFEMIGIPEPPEMFEMIGIPETPKILEMLEKMKSNNYDKNLQNYGLYFWKNRKKAINMMENAKIIALEI